MRALNGRFVSDSPRGRGTTLEILAAVRVIVADDSAVIREGVVRILGEGGADVVAQARTADELLWLGADELVPDLAIVDIRMPAMAGLARGGEDPATLSREGRGARLLSQLLGPEYAMVLLADGSGGIGYLLKDRVAAADELACESRPEARRSIQPWWRGRIRGRLTQERLSVLHGARARGPVTGCGRPIKPIRGR